MDYGTRLAFSLRSLVSSIHVRDPRARLFEWSDVMQPMENELAQGQILMLSTDEQSYAFDLWETFRVSVGRHPSNDIPLESRKVSNYHAEILNEGDGWLLRDLGSTNGTFLNDGQIRKHRLQDGDRIRIGGYEFRVNTRARDAESGNAQGILPIGSKGQLAPVREHSPQNAQQSAPAARRQPSVANLIRVLSNGSHCVLLVIRNRQNEEGRIFVDKGRVVHAELDKVRSEKALYRIFRWDESTYEVKALPPTSSMPRSIELPTDAIITEGTRQAEDWGQITHILPPTVVELRLKEDNPLPLSELSPAEIEIFKSLIRHQTIAKVLEESPMTDLRILEVVYALLKKEVFTLPDSSVGLLEETFVHRPK